MTTTQTKPGFFFIHGAGGTARKWRRTTAALHDVPWQAVDLPGHGGNKDGNVLSSIEAYADALAPMLTEEVIVVGHSMGGLIALELALRSPQVVGVVLAASHVRLPVHPKILTQLAAGDFPESLFRASYSKAVDESILAEERQELSIHPTSVTHADFLNCDRYRQGPETIRKLKVPVLAIYGADDRLLPPNAEQELLQLKPDAQVVTISEAGHYVMLEQPTAFVEAICRFREDHSKA